LNGINFKIIHGEAIGIVGAKSAGKSTLLNLQLSLQNSLFEVVKGSLSVIIML
jgi:ABC-type polysaccharide/polyol phosphate transport system ATPase subunit